MTGAESKPVNLFDRAFVNEKQSGNKNIINLMGEGFILLTRGYGFMGGGVYHPPFDTLKNGTSTDDIKLKLYR